MVYTGREKFRFGTHWPCCGASGGGLRATARPNNPLAERRHPRGTGLVAQQPIDPFLGEAFLPAPDAGLGLARPTHDLDGAEAARRKQDDLGPPGMLLRGVAVADDRLQAAAIDGAQSGRTVARPNRSGILWRIQSSDLIH